MPACRKRIISLTPTNNCASYMHMYMLLPSSVLHCNVLSLVSVAVAEQSMRGPNFSTQPLSRRLRRTNTSTGYGAAHVNTFIFCQTPVSFTRSLDIFYQFSYSRLYTIPHQSHRNILQVPASLSATLSLLTSTPVLIITLPHVLYTL